jgi:NAD-dependent dihydropyrimidine dehydrogenase PreA subunit
MMATSCGVWYPTIFPEKCDGCAKIGRARCVEFCPHGVFAFQDGKAIVANPHKCVSGCTACEPLCHNKAISFPKRESALAIVKFEEKGLLRKVKCIKCGKTFWTNKQTDVCFDCEGKH